MPQIVELTGLVLFSEGFWRNVVKNYRSPKTILIINYFTFSAGAGRVPFVALEQLSKPLQGMTSKAPSGVESL
jgi:hypothetical protein